ncbi:hypothetical protein [Burkholderia stagnalis]|uniref:hypothetical protein n=1 Tax=Burkholderia stagnalis TaxID=1503054 RepID=UPI0012DA7DAC|nr:hypothetical protein [Burkholderia stagnalis]
MIFYLAIVMLAEIRSSSTDSMSVTVTDDGRQRCTVESVFIGDGAIRGRRECQQVKRGY